MDPNKKLSFGTNIFALGMNIWKTSFLLGWIPGKGYVSLRECSSLFFHLRFACSVVGKNHNNIPTKW